jgi:hypothetical protein
MIDVAQAAVPSSDSWIIGLTFVTMIVLIIQTVVIVIQTGLFKRQTKILEEQARVSESVELSIKPQRRDPVTSAPNQLLLDITNEGKGVAMRPQVDCYIVNRVGGGTIASGSTIMQSIGPGRHEPATINLGGAITPNPNICMKYYWKATGSNGRAYNGSTELDSTQLYGS